MKRQTQLVFSSALETPPTARELLVRAEKFFGPKDPHCKKVECVMCELGDEIRKYLETTNVPQV